jgi:hypothetical protein
MLFNLDMNKYLTSPVRDIDATVDLYRRFENHSGHIDEFSSRDKLVEFTVERIGEENKFFGFGIA